VHGVEEGSKGRRYTWGQVCESWQPLHAGASEANPLPTVTLGVPSLSFKDSKSPVAPAGWFPCSKDAMKPGAIALTSTTSLL
jgi:hypothetical protein